RLVTLNLWGGYHRPDARLEVLLPQLSALAPEVVALQEALQPHGRLGQAERIARALKSEFRFAAVDGAADGATGNAIVSRLPILATSSLPLPTARPDDHRGAIRCDLATPCGRLAVISTHLSWELDAAPVRETQASALDAWARRNPGEIPTALLGDFNCPPDSL